MVRSYASHGVLNEDGWMDDAWREKEDYGMKHE